MKWIFVVLASGLSLAAQTPASQAPARKAPAKAATKAPAKSAAKKADAGIPPVIPPDAVPDGTGDFRHTDAQGKKWIYRQTPFGLTRREDTPETAAVKSAAADGAGIQATEEGEMVTFVRKGPFGVWKWTKNKAELDETEKAALRNAQAVKSASQQD